MALTFRSLFAILAAFAIRGAFADCTAYGVDFTNGGSYYIDGSSNTYFSFISVFQGCNQESISPILVDPSGNQYACSAINTQPANTQVTSQCGIPWSAMTSGVWKIVIQGNQIGVQRSITLTVGIPVTSTIIYTPTIVMGVTTTPKAQTVYRTVQATQTLIIAPGTVTANCNGGTVTVTNYPQARTVVVTSTGVRTVTDGQRTSTWATTITSQASCHYPTKKRDVAHKDQVAAVTVTYTETTYTVTQTVVTTARPATTTETVLRTITATVSPPATTVCNGNGPAQYTITINKPSSTITQTNVVYQTSHLSGTIWIGQTEFSTVTNPVSATACWRAGGWYGV